MSQTLEGVIQLQDPIDVAAEALELTYEGRLPSGSFTLALPQISSEGWFAPPTFDEESAGLVSSEIMWVKGGSFASTAPNGPPIAAQIQAMGFRFQTSDSGDDTEPLYSFAQVLGDQFDVWLQRFIEWLELWTNQSIIPDANGPLKSSGDIWSIGVDPPSMSGWGQLGTARIGFTHISGDMLHAAAELASEAKSPPDEWQIYARSMRWTSTRLKVIDASTAAEMAIEFRLSRELGARSELDDGSIDALLANAQGIVEKLRTLEALCPPDRSRVRRVADRIAGPRNSAVHAGASPTREVASTVTRTARELLDEYSPIPTPVGAFRA